MQWCMVLRWNAACLTLVSCAAGSECTGFDQDHRRNRRNWRKIVVQHKISGTKTRTLGRSGRNEEDLRSKKVKMREVQEGGEGQPAPPFTFWGFATATQM